MSTKGFRAVVSRFAQTSSAGGIGVLKAADCLSVRDAKITPPPAVKKKDAKTMSINPYESPDLRQSQQIVASAGYRYRPATRLVQWITAFFLIKLALSVALGAISLAEATVFVDFVGVDEVLEPNAAIFYLGYACIGLLYFPIYVTCIVLFCLWIYRANKNVRALGAMGIEHSPGWCVGSFFVPIINLFVPYKAVCEIYQASLPEADRSNWIGSPVSPDVVRWWGCWIASVVLGQIIFRMSMSDDPGVIASSAWLGVLAGIVAIPNALLAIRIVRNIHDRQERKAARLLQVEGVAVASFAQDPQTYESPADRNTVFSMECPWCEESVVRTADGMCPECNRLI